MSTYFREKKPKSKSQHKAVEELEEVESHQMRTFKSDETEQEQDPSEEVKEPSDFFDHYLEALEEKRPSIRVNAINGLTQLLLNNYLPDELAERQEALCVQISNSLKKGHEQEVEMACRLLAVCAITLGVQGEEMYKKLSPTLIAFVRDPQQNTAASASVVQVLGLFNFLASTSEEEMHELMEIMLQLWQKTKSTKTEDKNSIVAAALRSWGLLATGLPTSTLASKQQHILDLMKLLSSSTSLDVRTNAGENIGLIYHALLQHIAKEEQEQQKVMSLRRRRSAETTNDDDTTTAAHDNDDNDDNDDNNNNNNTPKEKALQDADLEALSDLLNELTTAHSRHRAKKELAKERSIFREVLKTIESGALPVQTLSFATETYELEGWGKLRRLESLREYLGSGFLLHFVNNPLLAQVLELDFVSPKQFSQADIRSIKNDNILQAKQRDRAQQEFNAKQRKNKKHQLFATS